MMISENTIIIPVLTELLKPSVIATSMEQVQHVGKCNKLGCMMIQHSPMVHTITSALFLSSRFILSKNVIKNH